MKKVFIVVKGITYPDPEWTYMTNYREEICSNDCFVTEKEALQYAESLATQLYDELRGPDGADATLSFQDSNPTINTSWKETYEFYIREFNVKE